MNAFLGFYCRTASEEAESSSYVALSKNAILSRQAVRQAYSSLVIELS